MSAGERSEELFARARRVIPGGVNSPVRAFGAVGGTPLFVIAAARGAEIDRRRRRTYLDFVGSWGPLILGHAHPEVVAAVAAAAERGTTFGAPCPPRSSSPSASSPSYPGLEQVRFVSSGTEAVMSAVRLARAPPGATAWSSSPAATTATPITCWWPRARAS
jgi:glutamate-1-semialdehyde 2,1-aminomutase